MMKKFLMTFCLLVTASAFGSDLVVDCHKVKGESNFRLIVKIVEAGKVAKLYRLPMASNKVELLFSEKVYFMTSPTSEKLAFVFDSETNGGNFELKLQKNSSGRVDQSSYQGKLTSGYINLRNMQCEVYK